MGRIVRYPIQLGRYLGRTWQAINRLGVPLDPLRLVLSRSEADTRVLTVDVRGEGGTRSLARLPDWILPLPGRIFDPEWSSVHVPSISDGYFPVPRPTWWPGERIVVECCGTQPKGAAILAGLSERHGEWKEGGRR